MTHQWQPWAAWALAGLALEVAGYLDGSGRVWTLSRVVRWAASRARWVPWAVGLALAWLWYHWFGV